MNDFSFIKTTYEQILEFHCKALNSPDLLEQLVPDTSELLATHFDLHDQTNTKLANLY